MSEGPLAGFHHVVEPAATDDAPVLLLLHGTGADERQLLGIGRVLAGDAALLSPRGHVVESDGMPRFFARIPTGDGSAYPFRFDDADVLARAGELAGFVEAAQEQYGLARRNLFAFGFSNGANVAAALLLSRPDLLRGAILAAPMPVLDDPPKPDLSANAALLLGGRQDPIASPEGVEALAKTLADCRASVEVAWHDGGHDLPKPAVEAAREWLRKLRRATAVDPLP